MQPFFGEPAGVCTAFTVFEDRGGGGGRQRFILWTKNFNEYLKSLYSPFVPLFSPNFYVDAVTLPRASLRDLEVSFFQVPLPPAAQKCFVFKDDSGNMWAMTRLPMGLALAPEILHTLLSTLSFHPSFSSESPPLPVLTHCWIDNVRWSGEASAVRAAAAAADARVRCAGGRWKAADSVDEAQHYTFLGVDARHGAGGGGEVRPAEKVLAKLGAAGERSVAAGELEALFGRLLWCSEVAAVCPAEFYFALKFGRRVANKLGRGVLGPDDQVMVPASVRHQLRRWRSLVLKWRPVRPLAEAEKGEKAVIFSDASDLGAGAVIVRGDRLVRCWGRRWSAAERDLHINVKEARALTEALAGAPPDVSRCDIDFFVDNTSALGAARRGTSTSAEMAAEVAALVREARRREVRATYQYVASLDNPADAPSRLVARDDEATLHEVLRFLRRL